MSTVCDKKGHDYYPTLRRVSGYAGLTYQDEDILYCRRCGDVKSLTPPPNTQVWKPWNGYTITWSTSASSSPIYSDTNKKDYPV